jgi:hypothetical protein
MRKLLLLFAFLLAFASSAKAQGFWVSLSFAQESTVAGQTNVVTLPPNPIIAFCSAPANAVPCTNKAATYTDSTLGTLCSTSTQFILNGTNSCVANLNPQNQGGVWVAAGQYAYTVDIAGNNFGPFFVTAPGINGVNTVNGLSGTVTLAAGTNVTITPSGNTLTIASTVSGGGTTGCTTTGGVAFENGTANTLTCGGSVIASGTGLSSILYSLISGQPLVSSTIPTITAAGCGGAAATITRANGTAAFEISVGTSNTGSCLVTMPVTTGIGWACMAIDGTATSANVFITKSLPTSANVITLQNYTNAGATHAWNDSDVLVVTCTGLGT